MDSTADKRKYIKIQYFWKTQLTTFVYQLMKYSFLMQFMKNYRKIIFFYIQSMQVTKIYINFQEKNIMKIDFSPSTGHKHIINYIKIFLKNEKCIV